MIFNCNSDLATSVLIGWGNSTAFVKIVYPVCLNSEEYNGFTSYDLFLTFLLNDKEGVIILQ